MRRGLYRSLNFSRICAGVQPSIILMPPRKAPSYSGDEIEQNEDTEQDVRLSEPCTEVSEGGGGREHGFTHQTI